MPLYEYQCKQCSEKVEIIQKMSDPPYELCPKCGGEMKKLFSSPAIQFKGSGFYKTDYASGNKADGKAAASQTESKSESGKSDAPKSDSGSGGGTKSDSGSSSSGSSSE